MRIAGRERRSLQWLILPPSFALAWWLARSMAFGGNRRYALIALAVVVLVARPIKIFFDRRVGPGAMAVEIPLLLMLMSTLVWRQRGADALAYDPLDPAAQLRVLCVGLALLLGGFALISPARVEATPRRRLTTLPFRVYLCYVAVVILGVPGSVKPFLTTYRAIELITGCVVLLGAYRALGNAAARRIEATIYSFTVALVASVWLGLIIDPSRASPQLRNISVPRELVGVYPRQAANTVGAVGAILTIWSLSRYINGRRIGWRRWVALALTLGGVVTTIAARYRTGYAAIVAGALVIFWLRRRVLVVLTAAAAVLVIAWSPSLVTTFQSQVLRGESVQEAQQLSGRVDWWSQAVPVWKRSPVIGRGLWTASRYEVLAPLGLEDTASLHSTWVEALVGTGVVGLTLLVICVLMTLSRAWSVARASPWAHVGPLALMVLFTIRSLTGNLFESFGHEQLLFLAVVLAMEDSRHRPSIASRAAADERPALVTPTA